MLSKVNLIVFTLLVAGVVLALSVLNRDVATLTILPGVSYTASLGVISLGLLFVGIVSGAVIAIYYGFKSFLARSKLARKEREEGDSVNLLLTARTFLATEEYAKAKSTLEKLAKRNNYKLLASLELTKVLEAQGEPGKALELCDELRSTNPDQFEVLLRSAELHSEMGNKTAALDALGLLLYKHESEYGALLARDLALSLEKYDQALQYQDKIDAKSGEKDETRAEITLNSLLQSAAGDATKIEAGAKSILKSFPDFAPALELLGNYELKRKNPEKAAAYFLKRAQSTHDAVHWDELRKLWLSQGSPERALSAANLALREAKAENKLEVELVRARLFISLSMQEEAKNSLATIESTPNLPSDVELKTRLLKVAMTLPGSPARDELLGIVDGKKPLSLIRGGVVDEPLKIKEAPAARLSTP